MGVPTGVDVLVQVLGPVRAWRDGRELDLGPPGRRAVLGLLALARGRALGRGELVDALWGNASPPPSATNVIQTHVKHLRRLLDPNRHAYDRGSSIPTVGDGYALRVPPDQLDVERFHGMVLAAEEAWRSGRHDQAAAALGEALQLWHGTPLADLPAFSDHPAVHVLLEARRNAVLTFGAAMIATRRTADALPVVVEEAAAQPLDETLAALLVRLYAAVGQRAGALAVYDRTRRLLAAELGVGPGPDLAAAHASLVRHKPKANEARIPAELPADVAGFTGRTHELAALDGMLAGTPVSCVVTGPAGVGKTALAIHWAHRVRSRFPDGQLFVNLRGFEPSGSVRSAGDAVHRFLETLGVSAQRIPPDLDAQAALYRDEIAGRRMLVVLDNARDAAQVRPLLPGTPGCLVLVTSRDPLTELGAPEGVTLELFTADEARELLVRRIGSRRTSAEPDAVAEIVARCARLPLALAVAAAHATTFPRLSLRVLVQRLRDASLDTLAFADDPATNVRTVFSSSYRALTDPAARLFRLLGLHPGPDIGAPAAASLAGVPAGAERPLLDELTRASLLVEHVKGRYTCHDLLGAYARDLTIDTDEQRRLAIHRLFDHYLHTAHSAEQFLDPVADPITLAPPRPGVIPRRLSDRQQALDWFAVEHPVLLAAVTHAAATGWDTHCGQLAWHLWTFLDRRGRWHDLATLGHAAVTAAARLTDPPQRARAHRLLAHAHTRLGDFADAAAELLRALDVYQQAGEKAGQAHTHYALGHLFGQWDRPGQALDHARQALDLYRATDHQAGQANTLNQVGWYHALLGDHRQALACCEHALAVHEELGDRVGQAASWDSLGYVHHRLRDHARAIACYEQARTLHRYLGNRAYEATTLSHLGDVHHDDGDPAAAAKNWRQALTILDDLESAEADQLRTKLAMP